MKKICLGLLVIARLFVPLSVSAQYASSVISYNPGAGFAAGYTNASAALGAPTLGSSVSPFSPPYSKSQLVSIGAGGQITLQMATPVLNNPADPYGIDFILFGNEFFTTSGGLVSGLYYHPASIVIQVSPDDVNWYTLNPSLTPLAAALFPTDGSGNPFLPVNPTLTTNNFNGLTLAGVQSLYGGSAGGTGYDLSWAENSLGQSISLAQVDYISIQVESGVVDLDGISEVQPVPDHFPVIWGAAIAVLALFITRLRFNRAATAIAILGLTGAVLTGSASATTLSENFSNNPLQDGWKTFGNSNLFQWTTTNQNLAVTWDSSQSNSYFYHPLNTLLTSNDDFTLQFSLMLTEEQASGYGFELAIGFFNLAEATSTNFLRFTGENSPDLIEFDYFPDVGYGPTLWPIMVDSNSDFNYNNSSDYAIFDPGTNYTRNITMTYTASNQTLSTAFIVQPTRSTLLIQSQINTNTFGNFLVNAISISSYQDDGMGDSIYATGLIDNIVVTLPPPPVQNLSATLIPGGAQVQFLSQGNWLYVLQRSLDLQSWTNISAPVPGNATNLYLIDSNAPALQAFYRVSASRP